MAVYSSPFRPSASQPPPKETDLDRLARETQERVKGADSAIQRVRAQNNLSADEKQAIIAEIERIRDEGGTASRPTTGFKADAGRLFKSVLGGVIAPYAPKSIQPKIVDALNQSRKIVMRTVQSGVKEASDALADVRLNPNLVDYALRRPSFTPIRGVKGSATNLDEYANKLGKSLDPRIDPKLKALLDAQAAVAGDTLKPSFKDFVSQIKDTKFKYSDTPVSKAVNEYSPFGGFMSDLIVEGVSDPVNYVTGVGNVKYVGRAGKLALAQRFSTKEMITKYPALAGKFNEIVRLGQHAPVENFAQILKSEGIQTGIRVLGKVVPNTDLVAAPVGRALSTGWEKIMDVATLGKKVSITETGISFSPKSRAFMQNIGRRGVTGGGYRQGQEEALKNIAIWSARQYGKGVSPYHYNKLVSEVRDIVSAAREKGMSENLTDLVERANPYSFSGGAAFASLPTDQQEIVRAYADWQRRAYAETESLYKKFGTDFGVDIPNFSFVEDYVYHKLTKDASKWMGEFSDKGKYRTLFRSGDLSASDVRNTASPLMYRKIRAPEVLPDGSVKYSTFMGEDVKEGTIRELNEIFARQSGTDIKFFETDIGIIADGYANSMAKMWGREAYVRRLMQYGDVAAAKLLDTTIPDPVLRAAARKELDEVMDIRNTVRARLNRRMGDLKSVLKQGIADSEDLIKSNIRLTRMNSQATDAVIKRIEALEGSLNVLRSKSLALGIDKRGEFDVIYSVLLNDIKTLKKSLVEGTTEIDEIRLGLQTTYQTMYPNATKIPDDIEVLADKISNARGIPASREGRAINVKLRELREQLKDLTPSSEEYKQLSAEVATLKDIDNGYRIMAEYRATQDYAPDNGFLFITRTEMEQVDDMQIPFKLLRTTANGFPDQGDVMGVRVFGNDEVIDYRTTGGMARTFGVGDFGDGVMNQLELAQIDVAPLRDALDAVRVGLPVDPDLENQFPEIADLVKLMLSNQSREAFGDPMVVKAVYEQLVDTTTGLLQRMGVDRSELVARNVIDGAIGDVARIGDETNSARGVMLPARLFDDAAEFDDVVVVLAPRVVFRATDSVTGPVQDSSSPLIQALMRTDAETAAGAVRGRLSELSSRKAEIDDIGGAVKKEIDALNRRKSALKGVATRRKNSAQIFRERAGTARNLPREVIIDGKVENLNLAQIDKRLEALTATEQRFRANMEQTLLREQSALKEGGITLRGAESKMAANTDRLKVLFDEALALHSWDIGTGVMIRDDIAAAVDLIGAMPPSGLAGEATQNWLARLDRGVKSSNVLSDPSARRAYERLHQLVSFDEWNLSIADEAVSYSAGTLSAIDAGKMGAILDSADARVLEGWEAIAGLGVQVPKEALEVFLPNMRKILAAQNRNGLLRGLDAYNKFFKTYALGTVGFVVRNVYSAVFMNAVAGVDVKTMEEAVKAMAAYNKFGAGKWLDELGIVGKERDVYTQAMQAVEASGRRGFFSDLAEPVIRGSKREKLGGLILDNPYAKSIRNSNSRAEDAVRFPLALKSIRNGDDYVTASQQVTRYHFDYTDLSSVDEAMLKVLPFWIWATRNLPNQLANQLMRPQVYSLYETLQGQLPTDDSVLMPKWMKDYEPLGLTRFGFSSVILRPDLPHQRLMKTLGELTNYEKLIGAAYPLYKLPAEYLANKRLSLDIPFSEKPKDVKGIDAGLARALNAILPRKLSDKLAPRVRDAEGNEKQMITDFSSYALGNAVPAIAVIQRLAGGLLGGPKSYDDRHLSSLMSFLGLPVDRVTDYQQGSEAINRQIGIGNFASELRRLGLLESATEFKKRTSDESQGEKNRQKRMNPNSTANRSVRAKEKAAQKLRDKNNLKRAKDKYGVDSPEYKLVKDLIDQRLAREKAKVRAEEVEKNPIKVAGDE